VNDKNSKRYFKKIWIGNFTKLEAAAVPLSLIIVASTLSLFIHIAPVFAQQDLITNISENSSNLNQTMTQINPVYRDTERGVFYTFSNDGGKTFAEPKKLSNNNNPSFFSQIGVAGNNVYVIWETKEVGTSINDVFYTVSNDGGKTFAEPKNLSNTSKGMSTSAKITVFEDKVHIIWNEDSYTGHAEDIVKPRDRLYDLIELERYETQGY
jgi:hypothetical protein